MKKMLSLTLVCAFALLLIGACSGTSKYDKEVCARLADKIKMGIQLTEDDYTDMIDQLEVVVEDMNAKKEKIADDETKKAELLKDKEFIEEMGYRIVFAFQLEKDEAKLTPDHRKRVSELGKKLDAMND